VLPKIKKVKQIIDKTGKNIFLEVDGGINDKNAKTVIEHGADVLVAGNYIFKHNDYREAIKSIK
jgi:ribulose-phosphate 3-epimerase